MIQTSIHGRRLGLTPAGGLELNNPFKTATRVGEMAQKRVTSAQVLALNATPQTIIAAPGAGLCIVPLRLLIYKPAGTAYADVGAAEDLALRYTNAAGALCSASVETTGFLDQATAQTRHIFGRSGGGGTADGVALVANAAVVLSLLSGEVTTGTSDLYVRVWYDVVETAFTF